MKYFKYLVPFSIVVGIGNVIISTYLSNLDRCFVNRGIAFGVRIEYEILFSILTIIILIYLSLKTTGITRYCILSIIVLGLSNLVFRLIYGYICDYINILNISFNIADAFIVICVSISIMVSIKKNENKY